MEVKPQIHAFTLVQCTFQAGHGWVRGGYTCQCKQGYFPPTARHHFNGSLVEVAYSDTFATGSTSYSLLYVCLQCPPGCTSCEDDTPCMAEFNWPFRSGRGLMFNINETNSPEFLKETLVLGSNTIFLFSLYMKSAIFFSILPLQKSSMFNNRYFNYLDFLLFSFQEKSLIGKLVSKIYEIYVYPNPIQLITKELFPFSPDWCYCQSLCSALSPALLSYCWSSTTGDSRSSSTPARPSSV